MDALAHFHFLRPWWLLVAIPPVLLAVLRFWGQRQNNPWRTVIAPHLLPYLVTAKTRDRWCSPEVVMVPLALVLAVAMAGPAYRLVDNPQGPDDTTLLVVVDLSASMSGRDIGPSRIGRLRLKLRDLIELRRGARMGLIAVAGDAHVVMPPTDDTDALVPYVDVLDPGLMPSDGQRFDAVPELVRGLVNDEKGPTVVLVAADSIPPDGSRALSELQESGISILGWAIGTKQGIPSAGVPGLDRTGFDALGQSGARVVDVSLNDADLRAIDRILDRARTALADPENAALWEDSGYGLSLLVALGVLYWFRRGWVIGRLGPLLLSLLLIGCGDSEGGSLWLDLWLTPDQQGRRLFDEGKYLAAAAHFEDPMWKGIAYYTGNDWKHAQQQFARVDSIQGLFNLANAHAQAREIASAVSVYEKVLERQPTFRPARRNRDYLKQVLAGLEQTSDWDDRKEPAQRPADPTQVRLRGEQTKGPKDGAEEADREQSENHEGALGADENERWMKRVATNPADFLRAKFSVQEGTKSP